MQLYQSHGLILSDNNYLKFYVLILDHSSNFFVPDFLICVQQK